MEILLGVILLLQVVILIQIMHRGNQVLQRLDTLGRKINNKPEPKERMQNVGMAECVIGDSQPGLQVPQENRGIGGAEKEPPEVLLNEVLSEVFS